MLRLVVLGSGASLPTLQRQTAALAVQREGDLYLFDCGEGTQLQWRRAGLRFGKLRAICLSHLHGDHMNGLVGFLQTLSLSDRSAPLTLYGPEALHRYLHGVRRTVGLRLGYPLAVEECVPGRLERHDGYELVCRALDHGPPCFGFALVEDPRPGRFDVEAARRLGVPEGPMFGRLQRGEEIVTPAGRTVRPDEVLGPPRRGKRVAYCVDTRPCDGAVELARGADLFVCEATFTRELGEEARARSHCTAHEAATMARQAGAKRLLLTHISARYHDPRPLLEEARDVFPETEAAQDLMELTV